MKENALVTKRIEPIVKEFKQKMSLNENHNLYAFTLYPKEHYVREEIDFYDDDARERLVISLYKYLNHRLSQYACKNYQRKIHKNRRMFSLVFIEHFSKDKNLVSNDNDLEKMKLDQRRVSPHIHATIAIHKSCEKQILECFERTTLNEDEFTMKHDSLNEDAFTLKHDAFKETSYTNFFNSIESTVLKRVKDFYAWTSYQCKEFVYQIDYLNHASVYQHAF